MFSLFSFRQSRVNFLLRSGWKSIWCEILSETLISGSQYENGMKALSEMERTQQVEAIQSYNSMKSDLMEYLKTFAQEGKVTISFYTVSIN